MDILLPPKSDESPKPAHVASFETYLGAINGLFLGADFYTDIRGDLHLNAASILAQDIGAAEHTRLEAAQVARDICTYTAERIALGRATTTVFEGQAEPDKAVATRGITLLEFDPRAKPTWQTIRPYVAHRLLEDLQHYRESLVDWQSPAAKQTIANIDQWKPIVRHVATETTYDVLVTDSPQLLPGVEVIALAHGVGGSKRFMQKPPANPFWGA